MFSYSKFKLLLMFNLFYFVGYQIKYKTMTRTTNVQRTKQLKKSNDCVFASYSFIPIHTCYLPNTCL